MSNISQNSTVLKVCSRFHTARSIGSNIIIQTRNFPHNQHLARKETLKQKQCPKYPKEEHSKVKERLTQIHDWKLHRKQLCSKGNISELRTKGNFTRISGYYVEICISCLAP
ncbi:hypothetical protein M8J76_010762 [Diaphorina citri]|nr:hypothetical protein M8J76_010762 [Diaphorina citri]